MYIQANDRSTIRGPHTKHAGSNKSLLLPLLRISFFQCKTKEHHQMITFLKVKFYERVRI